MERPRSSTDAVMPEISFTEIDDEEDTIRKRTIPFYSCVQCDRCFYCCQECCLINYCNSYPDYKKDPMSERIKEYQSPSSSYASYKSCCYRRVCGCVNLSSSSRLIAEVVSRVCEDEESFHVCFGFLSCFVFAPFFAGLLFSI